jgi:hypothetical protein
VVVIVSSLVKQAPGPLQGGDNHKNTKHGVGSFENLPIKNQKAGEAQIYMKSSSDIVHIQVCSNHDPWGKTIFTMFTCVYIGKIFKNLIPENQQAYFN